MRIAQFSILAAITVMAAAAQQEAVPTFSAGTRLVEVDVVARSKGAPATGLTKEDFTLFDNGKPQKIAFFSIRSARASGPAAQAAPPLPAGAVSNRLERESPGNTTALLIDQKNTPQAVQAFAIQRVVKFVETRRKGDRIGIYTFGKDGRLRAVQEISDDGELLSRAARSLKAQDPSYRDLDTGGMTPHAVEGFLALEFWERGLGTKYVLDAMAHRLASVPGRKSLIWVTTSFPLFDPELGIDFRPDMDDAARLLNDANTALYAVDAHGLIGALSGMIAMSNAESAGPQSQAQLRLQMTGRGGRNIDPFDAPGAGLNTMNMLADLTGGLVFYNKSNSIEESIRAAADDGELTYTLGFYPAPAEQDGASHNLHNLKVEVARRGVSVRYRQNYLATKTPAAANERPTLETLLKDPLDATQLGLVAETMPDPAKPGFWQVRVSVDLHDVHLENQNNIWVGAVDVSFFMEGSPTARMISRKVEIPADQLAAALEKGIAVSDSIAMNGPAGKLRIVAQDRATGAAGSVRVPLGRR
jgi:VWFA-related protein